MDRHLSADEDIDIDIDIESEITHNDDNSMDRQDGGGHGSDTGNDDEMIDDKDIQGEYGDNTSLIDEDLDDVEGSVAENAEALTGEEHQDSGIKQDVPRAESFLIGSAAETSDTQGQDQYRELREDFGDDALQVDLEQPYWDQNVQNTENAGKGSSQAGAENLAQETNIEAHDFDGSTKGQADFAWTEPARRQVSATGEPTSENEEIASSTPRREAAELQPESPSSGQQPEYQYLHPIIVVYQGNEMSLFPPSDQGSEQSQTYFLHDEAFARDSISNLLQQCRLVLDDSIEAHDKLELKIPDLGVNIDEIVDIYLHLAHNDRQDDPGPLYTELCVNTSCLNRLEYLLTAVADGKGLSQLEPLFAFEESNQDDGLSYGEEDTNQEQRTTSKGSSETYSPAGAIPAHADQGGLSNKMQKSPMPSLSVEDDAVKHVSKPNDRPVGTSLEDTEIENLTELADEKVTKTELFAADIKEDGGVILRTEEQKENATDDIIDYPNDDDLAGDSSAGSSTLQGDVNDQKASNLPHSTQASALSTPDAIDTDIPPSEYESASLDDIHHNLEGLLDQPALEDQRTFGTDKESSSNEHTAGIAAPLLEDGNDYSLIEEYEEANSIRDDVPVDESFVETRTQTHMLTSHTEDQIENIYEETQRSSHAGEPATEARSGFPEFYQHRDTGSTINNGPTVSQELGPVTNDISSSVGEANSGFGHDRFRDMPEKLTAGSNDSPTHLPLQSMTATEKVGSALDDADEITFDDDEDDMTIASKPSGLNATPSLSPHTLKRMRSSQEDDLGANGDSSESKRVRST
ncbi:MAG: hypothetical protein Q9191_000629 [Dirinaria sp. TL-2023a]